MLILTRKDKESIIIGEEIKITLVESHNGHAKIAIDAPKNISIYREEIFQQIKDENIKAAQLPEKVELFNLPRIKKITNDK